MPGSKTQMTQDDASRVQSATAKSGGDMSSDGFAARAQSAGDRSANVGAQNSGTGAQQGTSGGVSAAGKK